MTPLEIIRSAHKASGATVTELSDRSGLGRAKLGSWLAQARPGAPVRESVYRPPTADDVQIVVTTARTFALQNLGEVTRLEVELTKLA